MTFIPKAFFWKTIESMNEFIELEPLSEDFEEVYRTIQRAYNDVSLDATSVLNTACYLMTKIVHERPERYRDVDTYAKICSKELVRSYSAKLVMPIVYQLLRKLERQPHSIRASFTNAIKSKYERTEFWQFFAQHFAQADVRGKDLHHPFYPRPIPAEWLRGRTYDWEKLTDGYTVKGMVRILKLWRSTEEREIVADVMLSNLKAKLVPTMGQSVPQTVVNNFEAGSTAQVFNGDVINGTFSRK